MHVDDEVYACLNLYNDYAVEACLEAYEAQYGPTNIGFIGGSFGTYRNLTQKLDAIIASQNSQGNNNNNGGNSNSNSGNGGSNDGSNNGGSNTNGGNNVGNNGGINGGSSNGGNNAGSNGGNNGGNGGANNGGGTYTPTTDITDAQVTEFLTAQITTVYNTNTFV